MYKTLKLSMAVIVMAGLLACEEDGTNPNNDSNSTPPPSSLIKANFENSIVAEAATAIRKNMINIKNDRFRLEELIQATWTTKDDIDNLMWKICDDPAGNTEDELHNCLIGISELHAIRCRRLFDCFEKMINQGDIKS